MKLDEVTEPNSTIISPTHRPWRGGGTGGREGGREGGGEGGGREGEREEGGRGRGREGGKRRTEETDQVQYLLSAHTHSPKLPIIVQTSLPKLRTVASGPFYSHLNGH